MSAEHWQNFQKQQSSRHGYGDMPVDAAELERLRRKQGGLCSVKSLFCCLSVLVGRPPTSREKNSKRRQQEIVRSFENDDDSFGYNFDEQISGDRYDRLCANC
ncbi:hypothetical protein ACHAWU_010152 [Discostella pseudostelligera]|uniref:Uncharacterized protein n=1 Tax=Discostella pseudostelligera TaxID=259834 RepID=A0ABD3M0F9_9STRA